MELDIRREIFTFQTFSPPIIFTRKGKQEVQENKRVEVQQNNRTIKGKKVQLQHSFKVTVNPEKRNFLKGRTTSKT